MIDRNQFSSFFVTPENNLILTNSTSKKGNSSDDIFEFYKEVSPRGEIIATYRIWESSSNYPPFKTQSGWEKYDLNGNEVNSGHIRK
jgi:hypothetical protein